MGTEPETMHQARKIFVKDLNEQITCKLCGGYFVDATTIIECLHTFCRSCIVKYLQSNRYCPVCDVLIHKTKPLLNIRPDRTAQDVVYKLVPKLYHGEVQRRKVFYADRPETRYQLEQFVDSNQHIVTSDEWISLTLTYYGCTDSKTKRYLRCPAGVSVSHIQKLIRAKYGLLTSEMHHVEILYEQDRLASTLTLLDIAYIYSWKRTKSQFLELTYRIYEYRPPAAALVNSAVAEKRPSCNTTATNADVVVGDVDKKQESPVTSNLSNDSLCQNATTAQAIQCHSNVGNSTTTSSSVDSNNWKEVQLRISENGEMSIVQEDPSLLECINNNNNNNSSKYKVPEIFTVFDSSKATGAALLPPPPLPPRKELPPKSSSDKEAVVITTTKTTTETVAPPTTVTASTSITKATAATSTGAASNVSTETFTTLCTPSSGSQMTTSTCNNNNSNASFTASTSSQNQVNTSTCHGNSKASFTTTSTGASTPNISSSNSFSTGIGQTTASTVAPVSLGSSPGGSSSSQTVASTKTVYSTINASKCSVSEGQSSASLVSVSASSVLDVAKTTTSITAPIHVTTSISPTAARAITTPVTSAPQMTVAATLAPPAVPTTVAVTTTSSSNGRGVKRKFAESNPPGGTATTTTSSGAGAILNSHTPAKQPKQTILNHSLSLHHLSNNHPLKRHSQLQLQQQSLSLAGGGNGAKADGQNNASSDSKAEDCRTTLVVNSYNGGDGSSGAATTPKITAASNNAGSRSNNNNNNNSRPGTPNLLHLPLPPPSSPLSNKLPPPSASKPCYMPKQPLINIPKPNSNNKTGASSASSSSRHSSMTVTINTTTASSTSVVHNNSDTSANTAATSMIMHNHHNSSSSAGSNSSSSGSSRSSASTTTRSKSSTPLGYKTLRDPPKSWNSQISKANLSKSQLSNDPKYNTGDLKSVRPAKFFKMRNNLPRYLGCPSSGVKPMYQLHVSPDKDNKNKSGGNGAQTSTNATSVGSTASNTTASSSCGSSAAGSHTNLNNFSPARTNSSPGGGSCSNRSEIKKHSIVKIDPKTLKPISEKAPEKSSLMTNCTGTTAANSAAIPNSNNNKKTVNIINDLKINTSSVSIFSPLKLQNNSPPIARGGTSRSSPKSPHSPNKTKSSQNLLTSSPPNKRDKLNLNFTPSNPFIPNLQSPTMNPNQFLFPAAGGPPPGFCPPPYDPRVMAAYHSLLYGQRMAFVPPGFGGLDLNHQRKGYDLGAAAAPTSPKAQQTHTGGVPQQLPLKLPSSLNTQLNLQGVPSSSSRLSSPSASASALQHQQNEAYKSIINATCSAMFKRANSAPAKESPGTYSNSGGGGSSTSSSSSTGTTSSKNEKSLQNAVEKLTQNRANKMKNNSSSSIGEEAAVAKATTTVTAPSVVKEKTRLTATTTAAVTTTTTTTMTTASSTVTAATASSVIPTSPTTTSSITTTTPSTATMTSALIATPSTTATSTCVVTNNTPVVTSTAATSSAVTMATATSTATSVTSSVSNKKSDTSTFESESTPAAATTTRTDIDKAKDKQQTVSCQKSAATAKKTVVTAVDANSGASSKESSVVANTKKCKSSGNIGIKVDSNKATDNHQKSETLPVVKQTSEKQLDAKKQPTTVSGEEQEKDGVKKDRKVKGNGEISTDKTESVPNKTSAGDGLADLHGKGRPPTATAKNNGDVDSSSCDGGGGGDTTAKN